jgi:hypothetical protein
MLESELASPIPLLLQQHYRKPKILFTQSPDPINANSQVSIAVTSMLTLIAYRFAIDSQLPRLPYMTRLDVFILASTLLVFFSLIEVVATIILDNTQKKERAKKIDRYCRVIFPVIFGIASIATFAHPRG